MSKTIRINGTNYTSLFTPTGYTVSYIKRRGPNAGQMMDGSYTDDVRAVKAVVTCVCMPTNEAQLAALLAELAGTYVTVYYFDPREGYRTMEAMPSDPAQRYRGKNISLLDYWTGTVVTFTER